MRNIAGIMAVIALLGTVSPAVRAQSRYLDLGVNGIGLMTGYTTGESTTGFLVRFVYSAKGMSDIGITIGRSSGDINIETLMKSPVVASFFDEDIAVFRVAPFIAGYLLKQVETIPVAVGVGCAYVEEYYTGGNIDNSGLDIFTQGMEFSLFVDRKQPLTDYLDVYPAAGISYHQFKATVGSLSGAGMGELFDNDSRLSWGFSLGFAFQLSTRSSLLIVPAVRNDNNGTAFYRINLGIILTGDKPR